MWEPIDAANTRNFLSSITGQRLIEELISSAPKLNGSTLESRAISASEQEGAMKIIRRLHELQTATEERQSESTFLDTTKLD